MRVKYNKQVAAVLAASEARRLGKTPTPELGNGAEPIQFAAKRILGLDIALRKTGWGIIDVDGGRMSVVDCGAVVNRSDVPVSECMRTLNNAVRELIARYSPQIASIEGGFYCQNVRTAIVLGTARGATLGVLADAGLGIYEYAPRRVKQAVCGFGNASKGQVALLVAQALKIDVSNLSNDTTDALALAICHGQLMSMAGGLGLPDPL